MNEPRLAIDELGEAFGTEVADALQAGRWLQAAIDETSRDLPAAALGFDAATEASGGFGDRVMAALAGEPAPAPTGFLLPLRRRGILAGLWLSFRQASVAMRGAGRPALVRAAALAYVLVLAVAGISLTGVAGAGALGLFDPAATESPATPSVVPTPAPPTQPVQPSMPPSPVPATPSPSPSETPGESDDHGSGPEPSDDKSGPGGGDDNSGPGSSSSGSGSGGSGSGSGGSGSGSDSSGPGSGDATPRPTGTPKPSETPH